MIFCETDDGLNVQMPHKELMNDDIVGFILTVLKGREMYRCHYADMDHDDREEI